MQNIATLNDLYADFTAGLLEKQRLEEAIFRIIQKTPEQLGLPRLFRENRDEYISWLYPRLSRAIDTYRDMGSSFEAYIGTLIRMAAAEYRSRQARSYAAESAARITQFPEINVRENEPQYDEGMAHSQDTSLKMRKPRQYLILVLKCCCFVSDDFLDKISPRLGMEPEALHAMVRSLRQLRGKRDRIINVLRERANNQFFRCILYEHKLRNIPDDCAAARKLQERLERGRKRLANMRERLARLRSDPSNKQIAEILGLSRGTVDSALHGLKLRNDLNKDILN